jgi:hypothetical protein
MIIVKLCNVFETMIIVLLCNVFEIMMIVWLCNVFEVIIHIVADLNIKFEYQISGLMDFNFLSKLANVRPCISIHIVSDILRTLAPTESNDALGGGVAGLCAGGVSVGLHPAPVHGHPAQPHLVWNSPMPRCTPGLEGTGGADIEIHTAH